MPSRGPPVRSPNTTKWNTPSALGSGCSFALGRSLSNRGCAWVGGCCAAPAATMAASRTARARDDSMPELSAPRSRRQWGPGDPRPKDAGPFAGPADTVRAARARAGWLPLLDDQPQGLVARQRRDRLVAPVEAHLAQGDAHGAQVP